MITKKRLIFGNSEDLLMPWKKKFWWHGGDLTWMPEWKGFKKDWGVRKWIQTAWTQIVFLWIGAIKWRGELIVRGERCGGQCKVFFFSFSKGDYYNLFADVLSGSNSPMLIRQNGDWCRAKVLKQVRGWVHRRGRWPQKGHTAQSPVVRGHPECGHSRR